MEVVDDAPSLCSLLFQFVTRWIQIYLVLHLIIVAAYLSYRYLRYEVFAKRIEGTRQKGILITGATSGIGLLLAKNFYKLGFTIFAAYFDDREIGYSELKKLNEINSSKPQRIFFTKMDVRSQKSIKESSLEVDAILKEQNIDLYCLINNAGVANVGPFEWADYDSIKGIIDTNVTGLMWVTRQFLLRIIQCKGRVLNVSSGLGRITTPQISAYSSSKAAVAHFSEGLNFDLARYGIRCHCVYPGNFVTNTNLSFSRLKSVQESKKKLSQEEALQYSDSIDESLEICYGALRQRMNRKDESWKQAVEIFKVEVPDHVVKMGSEKKKYGFFTQLFVNMMEFVDGSAEDLESCGLLRAYEQVVCLENPPTRTYAGSPSYQHFFGPYLFELSGVLILDLVNQLSSRNMFRFKN